MRKFDFDNLDIVSAEPDMLGELWFNTLTPLPLDIPVFAPQPGPLFATVNGTPGDDILTGTSGDDILIGGAGNDIINGGDGVDIAVFNASGEYRVIDLGNGDAYVRMLYEVGDGLDLLTGIETLRFDGINGTDFDLSTLAVAADINGTSGDNTLSATDDDIVLGFAGNDTITGTNLSTAEIYAGAGDDIVTTASGSNGNFIFVYGDVGNDTLNIGRVSFGTIEGGDGVDILNIDFSENSIVNGGAGDDTFNITYAFDTSFSGGMGNDIFRVENSFIYDQEFTFDGGDGDDDVEFSFHNATSADLMGGAGIDTLRTSMDFEELDFINSFGGTIDITNNATAGAYSELTLSGGFEVLIATGGGQTDTLRGGSGNDVLEDGGFWAEDGPGSFYYGNGGDDALYGMAGDDEIIGTGGQDILSGGDGDDVITSGGHYVRGYTDSSGDSSSETVISRATMIGGEGNDVLNSYGVDTLEGGQGDDILINHGNSAAAIYSSTNAADYIFTEIAMGEYTVEAIGGTGEGTDALTGVETIRLGGINGLDFDIATLAMNNGTITGTSGDDVLDASFDDIVFAFAGDDIINADDLSGAEIYGGDGNDTINIPFSGGLSQLSFMYGEDGNDIFNIGYTEGDTIDGGAGDDVFNVDTAYFSDFIGGDGNDLFNMGPGGGYDQYNFTFDAGAGDDTVQHYFTIDSVGTLTGGDGIDTLIGFTYFDDSDSINEFGGSIDITNNITGGDYAGLTITGGFEILIMEGGGEADFLVGGSGNDILEDGGFYTFFGGTGTAFGGNGNNDTLIGGGGDDIIIGTGGIDTLSGGDGDDMITSGSTQTFTYNDLGDTGSMTREAEALINGGDGNDIIYSYGNDTIDGGAGDDIIVMGRSERDTTTTTEGGAGIDTLSFSNLSGLLAGGAASSFLAVDLQGQSYSLSNSDTNTVLFVDTFGVFENAIGSDYRDLLQGDGLDNVLHGLSGDDMLEGRAGIDTAIYSSANAGDYRITETGVGEYTVESLITDEGTDTLIGIETIRLGGADGTDYDIVVLANTGITLDGTSGNDTLNGTPGADVLNGLGGSDIFNGLAGDDLFIADFSDLEFNGGEGYDEIRFDYDVDGSSDTIFPIDFRDYDIDSIEEITLNPTLVGGGAGSTTYYFEFGVSQFDQLHRFDALTYSDVQIFNDGVNALDLTDFVSPIYDGLFTVYGGAASGETFTLTIDQDPVEFIGAGNDDVIISLHDPSLFWRFTAFGDTRTTSIDTVDFSQMLTVENSFGTPIGLMTFDLGNHVITQTGLGLSNDSFARIFDFDIFIGWDGDDVFITDENDNTFIGNAGDNTAVYSSLNTADYNVTEIAPGEYIIQSIGGTGEGTDTLIDIQTIRLGGVNGTDYDIDVLAELAGPIDLTNGDDVYVGTAGDDNVNGLDGNDIISGEDGNDILSGDGGNDTLRGGNGNDVLYGGDGDDTLSGENGSDVFDGGAGSDTVSYASFGDEITVDLLTGTASDGASGDSFVSIENVTGSAFENTLRGDSNDNVLTGGDLNDILQGRNGNDMLIGGAGDDRLDGGRGEDVLFGGEGDDILTGRQVDEVGPDYAVYLSSDPIDYVVTYLGGVTYTVRAVGGTGEGLDTLTGIDFIRLGGLNGTDYDISMFPTGIPDINLTNGDDDYTGTSDDEVVNGLDGNDIIRGLGGDDRLDGGAGNDTLIGGEGSDLHIGGEGIDTASWIDSIGRVAVDLFFNFTAFAAAGDGINSIENLTGSDFDDILRGDALDNVLIGGAGADNLVGRGGADLLFGEAGDDVLDGGAGTSDIAVYSSLNTADYIVTETELGTYTIEAIGGTGEGIDTLTKVEFIRLGGLNGTDYDISMFPTINGDINLTQGNDVYSGTVADEIINALGGDDIFDGGTGHNTLNGDAGNDTLISLGNDVLNGGTGDDIIEMGGNVFDAATATDGGLGFDTISFSSLAQLPSGNVFLVLDLQGLAYSVRDGSTVLYVDQFSSFENATGSEFGDLLQGDAGANVLFGLGGDDMLQGRDGDDSINGGAGSDTAIYSSASVSDYTILEVSAGVYTVEATGSTAEGFDTLTDVEFLRLGGTTYAIETLAGGGIISLTTGDDVYSGGPPDVIINALAGDDVIDGGTGNNTLNGDAGDDTLISLGNDVLNGGTGNDTVEMGGNVFDAATATDGGADIDTISFSTLAQFPSGNLFLVVDLNSEAYSVRDSGTVLYVDQFTNFENATGSEFGDLLQGDAGANRLSGLGGDDNLQGREGDDTIDGGTGADILNGGVGLDTATYASAAIGVTAIMGDASLNTGDAGGDSYIDIENITGSSFDDVLGGDANANIIYGGAGRDIASYAYASSAIVFDGLGLVTASGDIVDDTLVNIEGIAGTAFNDRLFGDNDASIFYGGEGADRLFGRNGDDELYGEGGNDIIIAGRDNDFIDGGAGNDQLRGNEGDDTIFGGDGNDAITGGAGADAMDGGAGIDRVEYTYGTNAGVTASLGDSSINTGDAAGDTYVNIENLYGTSFNDELYGDAGNNRIEGRVGDDMLFGGEGNDYLLGGSGDDVLNGEGGNDLFLGQAGADVYQFDAAHGTDRIVVFTQGEDLIEFTENVFDFSGLTITQDGSHVNIVSSEGTIIVNNSLVADFAADDFMFATPPANEPLGQELLSDDLFAPEIVNLMAMDFEALI